MSSINEQPEQPLCIHFVNTVSRHDGRFERDHFTDFEGFLAWTQDAALFSRAEVQRWNRWARSRKTDAGRFLSGAIQFREYLFELFSKSASAQRISPAKLTQLNDMLATTPLRRILQIGADGVVEARECGDGLMVPLRKVALSAADILLNDSWRKIICCDRDQCDWLAIDTSRNHSRRYCSSAGCGNLARVTRHYRRRKAHAGVARHQPPKRPSVSASPQS